MAEKRKRERPGFNRDIAAAISKHYQDVQSNRPLAYTLMSSNPLVEVAHAAGIQLAFPENYACVCAARHASGKYCETAEAYRYAPEVCSYCRTHLGYVHGSDDNPPMGGLAEPDLLLMTSSACTHYFKWWDTLHEIYRKPLVFVNTPRVMEPLSVPGYYIDYAIREIEGAIAEIDKILGIKIAEDRLARAVKLSGEAVDYWQKILELQKAVPCPMDLSDLGNALFVLIVLAGTQEGVDLMRKIYDETRQRVTEGKGILSMEEERHRLLWMNIPLWYRLGIFGYFEDQGCVFPFSDYTQYIWGTTRMDGSEPLESLARKALSGELNTSLDDQIDKLLNDIKEYKVDGVIAHSNRSCRVLSVGVFDAVKIIREALSIPTLVLDCDHTDERVYSEANVMQRIEAFLEMLG
ncbi:MAG: 2-hydroxyacyl-CoA dehydratase family protein [Desulfobacteraceae bacterium]|jgi:benzoyl-CoA reductase/2-hydroxyglutaryl-CoA dehydratase subunit BcrC/BadD/HgdB